MKNNLPISLPITVNLLPQWKTTCSTITITNDWKENGRNRPLNHRIAVKKKNTWPILLFTCVWWPKKLSGTHGLPYVS